MGAVLKRWILALSIAMVAIVVLLAQAAEAQEAAGRHQRSRFRPGPA